MSSENLSEPILATHNLTKQFGSYNALSNVSLQIPKGSLHAIVGENGAGKTTLLKHLFGMLQPTSGEIFFKGNKITWRTPMEAIRNGIGMVQQHFTLVEELSALDNIILGSEPVQAGILLDRTRALELIETTLPSSNLAVPWNLLVSELSVGQKQKIEILKLLFRQSQILFLDEPTAVLTPDEILDFFKVLKILKDQGRTIVIITHKLSEVFAHCETLTVLRQGRAVADLKVSETTKEIVIEYMIGRKPKSLSENRKPAGQEQVLAVANLSEKSMERGSLKNISLQVQKGEIVGIAGVEGSGQSHLVEILLGLRPYSGQAQFLEKSIQDQNMKSLRNHIGYIPEDRLAQGLWPQENCFHNLILGIESDFATAGWLQEARIKTTAGEWAQSLDVRSSSLSVSASSLSGGNQQKIILARETRGKDAVFYICHHPTRGVDLGAIELIHEEFLKLRNEGHSLLVISSDLDELMALSDRLYVLFNGKTVSEFSRGHFDISAIGRGMTGVGV